jgi:hypothetical protein
MKWLIIHHHISHERHLQIIKSPFVCVVASAFEATTANMMFGYTRNTI